MKQAEKANLSLIPPITIGGIPMPKNIEDKHILMLGSSGYGQGRFFSEIAKCISARNTDKIFFAIEDEFLLNLHYEESDYFIKISDELEDSLQVIRRWFKDGKANKLFLAYNFLLLPDRQKLADQIDFLFAQALDSADNYFPRRSIWMFMESLACCKLNYLEDILTKKVQNSLRVVASLNCLQTLYYLYGEEKAQAIFTSFNSTLVLGRVNPYTEKALKQKKIQIDQTDRWYDGAYLDYHGKLIKVELNGK